MPRAYFHSANSANAKAAFQFFDNDSVSEEHILSRHFRATKERIAVSDAPVLYLHDTTEGLLQAGG